MAIRDMDIAAELMGIRPLYAKLTAFAVSSFIVGVAGALWAFVYLGAWEPLAFLDRALVAAAVHGDHRRARLDPGPFLGAAFILLLPILLNLAPAAVGVPLSTETITHLEFIIFGSLIFYLLIKEPHGFARLWLISKEKLQPLALSALRMSECAGGQSLVCVACAGLALVAPRCYVDRKGGRLRGRTKSGPRMGLNQQGRSE